jgi:type I thyroxine 5'-deiodinase
VQTNVKDKLVFDDPKTTEERRELAKEFCDQFDVSLPILVDSIEDQMESAFAAWPDRIYVIDAKGKIAYKGKPGPFGFKVDEAEQALKKCMAK